MRTKQLLIIAPLAAALAACGSGQSTESPAQNVSGNSPASSAYAGPGKTLATAEKVNHGASSPSEGAHTVAVAAAAKERGDVKCPVDVPAQPAGTPVGDVRGVLPRMSYEQAMNAVRCSDPELKVVATKQPASRPEYYYQPIREGFETELYGQKSNWSVKTFGLPGQEKVMYAARGQSFAEGANPSAESVEQALIAKYGKPTRIRDDGGVQLWSWVHDPSGQPITARFNKCDSVLGASPDCGVVVQASIAMVNTNHALVKSFDVSVGNLAYSYSLRAATMDALKAMDAARRAKEVKDATQNAQAPKL